MVGVAGVSEGEGPGLQGGFWPVTLASMDRRKGIRVLAHSAQNTVCKILDEKDVTSVVTAAGVEPSTDSRFSMPRKTAKEGIA
jgi:hypothetical protein